MIEGDSDFLHYAAVFGGIPLGSWHEVFRSAEGLSLALSPALLADDLPAPDDLSALDDPAQ